jgi:RNA polymerase sigma factor (sigma-70 family)
MEKKEHNLLFTEFLSLQENVELFVSYKKDPTIQKREALDQAFKQFYKKVRAISYLSKVIHFESKRFDKQLRKDRERNLLILDKPSNEEETTIKDLLADESSENHFNELNFERIEDYIHNPVISKSIKNLTSSQKRILFLAFIRNLKDIEIAKKLCISQQAVTKTKNKALMKVRRDCSAGCA